MQRLAAVSVLMATLQAGQCVALVKVNPIPTVYMCAQGAVARTVCPCLAVFLAAAVM